MSRTSNDGREVDFKSDGSVDKVDGESVERGMSGTTCWDKDGNAREDRGPSSDTNGDRY